MVMDASMLGGRELPQPAAKAVVLYDELESAVRAKDGLERAATNAEMELPWEAGFWRFDSLEIPVEANASLACAVDAELMLVVMRGQRSLPDAVSQWLETWATHRKTEDSALSLLAWDATELQVAGIHRQLQNIADRHGLVFVRAETLMTPADKDYLNALAERQSGMTPTLEQILEHSSRYRHFGLNE